VAVEEEEEETVWAEAVEVVGETEEDAISTQMTSAMSVESEVITRMTAAREVVVVVVEAEAGAGPGPGPAAETVHTAVVPAPDPALGPGLGIKPQSLRLLQRISNFYPLISQDNKTGMPLSLCVCVVRV